MFVRAVLVVAVLASCESAKSHLDGEIAGGAAAAGGGSSDCAAVVDKVRGAYPEDQVAQLSKQPKMARWFEATLKIVGESCEQDAWPDSVKACALALQPGDRKGLTACNQAMPADLQKKMQARVVAAMKTLDDPRP